MGSRGVGSNPWGFVIDRAGFKHRSFAADSAWSAKGERGRRAGVWEQLDAVQGLGAAMVC